MSVKKFKFVSPGIFLSEVDNSQLPAVRQAVGPVIIGRTPTGPSMRPYRIDSPSEFVQVFGNPVAGAMAAGDVWREGNLTGPTYASYAAMAYLKANVGPITMVRLLGEKNPDTTSTTTGLAGWETLVGQGLTLGGGAYGLWIFPSASLATTNVTGTLGAIVYVNSGSMVIHGSALSSSAGVKSNFTGYNTMIESQGTDTQFDIGFWDDPDPVDANTAGKKFITAFNFDRNSDFYIRNVLNTNPQMVNSDFVAPGNLKSGQYLYWLGETFEQNVEDLVGLTNATWMILTPLATGSTLNKNDYKMDFQYAKTGYFFSQDLSSDFSSYNAENMTKLFRVVSQDGGRWTQDKFKISIRDIKAPSSPEADPYGSFTLVVRAASDTDNVVRVIEQFTNVNLNPASENYLSRVVGDTYYKFDYDNGRVLRQYGQYANKSKYIRIEMNSDVDQGLMDAQLLPFGCSGPLRFKPIHYVSGSSLASSSIPEFGFIKGSGSSPGLNAPDPTCIAPYNGLWIGDETIPLAELQFNFPQPPVRLSASDGGIADPTDAYFGVRTTQGRNSSNFDSGYGDYMWRMPAGVTAEDSVAGVSDELVEYGWMVSLDDVITTSSLTQTAVWVSGSRREGDSATASGSWTSILDAGYDRITAPMYGGFDGLDIREAEPFRNGFLNTGTPANLDTSNYAFNSIKRAIDTVKDPEFVECNAITIPGVTNASLTQHLLNTCEDRADSLAIIDLPSVYTPFTDDTGDFETRNDFTVQQCIDALSLRQLNTSYGCTYYPWVQILDTISNNLLWVPPSVVALGTLASSEAKSEVWFAPAGFNRGGLTEGASGWPVTNITKRLTSKDRDNLYEVNINPIATFPSEGIVIFGQKTLQVTRSALDRINVRRLLIYIKKQVSRIASGILFDQNVQVTWNRFLGEVQPFLASVQSRLGLTEWKVILDDTTTTPDLIDQNIMYAKIFLKPARAIEFIAVDFVITRTGASFDD
jgi:hypothetical protein